MPGPIKDHRARPLDRARARARARARGYAIVVAALVSALACAFIPISSATAQVRHQGAERLPSLAPVAPVPAVPLRAARLGSVAPSTQMAVDVVLRPRDPGGLAELALAVSTPGSALRGDYRSPAELRREFGPSTAEVQSVKAGLRNLGLHVGSVSPDHLTIHVHAAASVLAHALHTSFESYRLPSGRVAFANTSLAALPYAIGSRVETVIGLSDVARYVPLDVRTGAHPASKQPASHRDQAAPTPCNGASAQQADGAYTSNELAKAYGMTGLYSSHDFGRGVTVGIFELEKDATSDIDTYETCYGISTKVSYIKVDGGATGSAHGVGEATLDIEDVAGLAPKVNIEVYQAPNDSTGPFDEFQYMVDHPTAKVVTTSWGECEADLAGEGSTALQEARAESNLFELAAAEGQSWMSAAGDDGSTDCTVSQGFPTSALAVDDPGSQPYVTSVGGTTLHLNTRGNTERVWNDSASGSGAGGGGISELWPMPAYQAGASKSLGVINKDSSGKPCDAVSGYCREVPDITADADPDTGYVIFWFGGWQPIGGTSAAAPLWAAVTALTDASAGCGGNSVGFLNPLLYSVAGSKSYSSDLTDITAGNNDFTLSGYKGGRFPATTGYDMASGLGSPHVTSSHGGLASALCSFVKKTRPGVDSVSPDSGPAKGGNTVTVKGYGFADVTAVYVGSKKAKFKVESSSEVAPTKLEVTLPAGSGNQWVTVHNGTYTNAHTPGDSYIYKP